MMRKAANAGEQAKEINNEQFKKLAEIIKNLWKRDLRNFLGV